MCCLSSLLQTGASPLYTASQEGHSDVVDVLLKNGADINQANNVETTRGYFIVLSFCTYSYHRMVQHLCMWLVRKDTDIL